ncbi:MAG: DNA-deoxyinosine glycosylase [Clostridia bacterium]|nr:DNA-deoxyinosine glycosylase [Clostridia bacterium]
MEGRIQSYPPVVNEGSRVLIVGSMPSVESLRCGFYYAHPRNAFWRILSEAFERPMPQTIDEKKRLILDNHLALWDVYASCERQGSLDSAIKNGSINDFAAFFLRYPAIRVVLANGTQAFNAFPKGCNLKVLRMPSTSPAYTKPYQEKSEIWNRALHTCLEG